MAMWLATKLIRQFDGEGIIFRQMILEQLDSHSWDIFMCMYIHMSPRKEEPNCKIMASPYSGILFERKKAWTRDIYIRVDASLKYHTKWKKPDTKAAYYLISLLWNFAKKEKEKEL